MILSSFTIEPFDTNIIKEKVGERIQKEPIGHLSTQGEIKQKKTSCRS